MDKNFDERVKKLFDEATALNEKYGTSKDENDLLGSIQIFQDLFNMHIDAKKEDEALLYYEDTVGGLMRFIAESKKTDGYLNVLFEKFINLGIWYSDKGNFERSKIWFEKFFEYAGVDISASKVQYHPEELEKSFVFELKAKACFFYAILCRRTKRFKECLIAYDKAFGHYLLLKDKDPKFMIQMLQLQSNVAFVHDEMGNFDMANTYFLHVLEYWNSLNSKSGGQFAEQANGIIAELGKLYLKYGVKSKQEILAELKTSNDYAKVQKLIDELRKNEVPKHSDLSISLMVALAEKGSAEAQCSLGSMYAQGVGVKQDHAVALEWFTKAAQQGYAPAQYSMGVIHAGGYAVEASLEEAAKWWTLAAEQGHMEGLTNAASCYRVGMGVEKDLPRAFGYFLKAAEQGDSRAEYMLGTCYLDGDCAPKDIVKAKEWLQKAAAKGHPKAVELLKELGG
jgi:hypothetical protein